MSRPVKANWKHKIAPSCCRRFVRYGTLNVTSVQTAPTSPTCIIPWWAFLYTFLFVAFVYEVVSFSQHLLCVLVTRRDEALHDGICDDDKEQCGTKICSMHICDDAGKWNGTVITQTQPLFIHARHHHLSHRYRTYPVQPETPQSCRPRYHPLYRP